MEQIDHPISVGILAYRNSQQSAVLGLSDLLKTANKFQQERTPTGQLFTIKTIESVDNTQSADFTVVVLPPCLDEELPLQDADAISDWLRSQHQLGALVCSICAGAFLLAESGLLNQRPATTHWAFADVFAQKYPSVSLDTEKLIVDDTDIITAGGVMAWVDLGLRLVERFMGPSIMLATARYFLADPVGREQRFYSIFSPPLGHGDRAILKAQHWLQSHYHEPVPVEAIATVAGLERRTLIRRFKKSTRLTPSEYLQQLRVGQAREKLELTRSSVDNIAWDVGYEDVSAFRRVFQKITGLTPREYRKRFSVSETR